MPRKKIDKLVAFAKDYGAKGLAYIAIQEDGTVQVFICQIYDRRADESPDRCNGRREPETCFSLRQIRIKSYGQYLAHCVWNWLHRWICLDKNEYKFLWVTEFPLLEWNDEQNRFTAMHHPFTMPMEEDLQLHRQ